MLGIGNVVGALESISKDISEIPERISEIPSSISNGLNDIISWVSEVIQNIWDGVVSVLESIIHGAESIGGYVYNSLEMIASKIEEFFKWLWGNLTNIFADLVSMLERILKWLWLHINNLASWIKQSLGSFSNAVSLDLSNAFATVINRGISSVPDMIRYDSVVAGAWKGLNDIMNAKSTKDLEMGLLKLIGVPLVGAIAGDIVGSIYTNSLKTTRVSPLAIANGLMPVGGAISSLTNTQNASYTPAEKVVRINAIAEPIVINTTGLIRTSIVPSTVKEVAYPRVAVDTSVSVRILKNQFATTSNVEVTSKATVRAKTGKPTGISVTSNAEATSKVVVKAENSKPTTKDIITGAVANFTSNVKVSTSNVSIKYIFAGSTVKGLVSSAIQTITVYNPPTSKAINVSAFANASSSVNVNKESTTPPVTTKTISVNSSVLFSSSASITAIPVHTVTPEVYSPSNNTTTEKPTTKEVTSAK